MNQFKCQPCKKAFGDKNQLDKHLLIDHDHKGTNRKPFKCQFCESSFAESDSLKTHVQTQHTSKTSEQELEHCGNKEYKCPICRQSFTNKQEIQEHKNRHTAGIKPYKCHLCEKRFTEDIELKLHLDYHAGVSKPYECGYCQKRFAQHAHWTAHRRTHTGDKPFKCDSCPKSFRQQSHLSVHKNIHTGTKPFECSICKERFRLPHTLKSHMTRHTGEKPYKCQQCPKAFSQSTPLSHHIKIVHGNDQFSCEYENCDKVFPSEVQLKTHIKVHYQVRKFFCLFCNKGCFKKGDLMKHLRSHTQERPFACTVCDTWYHSASRRKACQDSHVRNRNSGIIIPVLEPPPPPEIQYLRKSADPPNDPAIETVSLNFQCKICDKFMKHQNQLNGHMNIHKLKKSTNNKKKKKQAAKIKKKTPITFFDPLTEFVPDNDDQFDIEIEYHTNDETETCTFGVTINTQQEDRSRSPSPPESELRIESVRHIPVAEISQPNTPTNFRPFQCEFCNKMYAEKEALDKHMSVHGVVFKKPLPAKEKVTRKNASSTSYSDLEAKRNTIFKGDHQQHATACPEMGEKETTATAPPAILEIFDDDDGDEEEQNCDMPKLEEVTMKTDNDPMPIPPVLVDETRDDLVTKLLNEVITLDDEMYNCGACGTSFSIKSQLDRHSCGNLVPKKAIILDSEKKKVLMASSKFTSTIASTTPAPAAGKKKKSVQCNICKRFFGNAGALAGHKKAHIFDVKVDKEAVNRVCRICWRSFPTKSILEKHMQNHKKL